MSSLIDEPKAAGLWLVVGLHVRHDVCSSSDSLLACLAVPDADRVALDGDLAAEGTCVAGVLGDFHLLHLLSQGGTVAVRALSDPILHSSSSTSGFCDVASKGINEPCAIFTGDSDLCGAG